MPRGTRCRDSHSTPGRSAAARMIAVKRSATTSRASQSTSVATRITKTTSVAIATRPAKRDRSPRLAGRRSRSRSRSSPSMSSFPAVTDRWYPLASLATPPEDSSEGRRRAIRPALPPVGPDDTDQEAEHMKRLGLLLVVVGLAGGALATANASTTATRTICHRTASAKNPYVKVPVSAKQLRAHAKHAADIVLAGGKACPRTRLMPTAGGRAFTIALTGEAESPAADPVATATATVRVRAGQGQLCYQVAAENLPPAVAMHIHRGAAGVAGPVVVPLATPGADGKAQGCAPAARP